MFIFFDNWIRRLRSYIFELNMDDSLYRIDELEPCFVLIKTQVYRQYRVDR